MALKPNRNLVETDVSFFLNTINSGTTEERGGIVSLVTSGSGAAMDQSNAVCRYVVEASGAFPLGIMLNDVVNIDQTRQHINQHKDEVQVGNKVSILRQGWIVTDKILDTPTVGDKAYLAESGNLRAAQGINEAPIVGRFLSTKDANGYAKVEINIDTHPAPPLTVAD